MISLQQNPDGIVLPVKAQPRARRNKVAGTSAGRLKVAVTEVPEKGKANEAIVAVLAESLELSSSQIRLLRGTTSDKKDFLVSGVPLDELSFKIAACLSDKK